MNSDDRRALNLAMAELCGYPVVQRGDPCPAGEHARERPEGIWLYTAENGIFRGGRVWSPVTNPAQALEVAEVLRRKGHHVRMVFLPESRPGKPPYYATVEDWWEGWRKVAYADTITEAICAAALETLQAKGR